VSLALFLWLICPVVAGLVAARRDRAGIGFILGLVLGPLGIVAAFVIRGNRRLCTFCKELVHNEATVCPHCQRVLPRLRFVAEAGTRTRKRQSRYSCEWREQLAPAIDSLLPSFKGHRKLRLRINHSAVGTEDHQLTVPVDAGAIAPVQLKEALLDSLEEVLEPFDPRQTRIEVLDWN